MNFQLSDEQKELQEAALKFAKNEMSPHASTYDEKEELPLHILEKAWSLGLMNLCIPESCGGVGFSTLDSLIITESLSYGCLGMSTAMMANDLALLPIVIGGTEDQKKKFLTSYTEEFKLAAFCLTEPNNGSDAAGITTTIQEDGDELIINGQKMWITNAGFAKLFTLYGTVNSELGHKGISAVVIEADRDGIELGAHEKKMGQRCSDTRSVTFNNVRIPKENLLGQLGDGWKIAMKTLDHSRPMVASAALGAAQAAYDHAVIYAEERKQFGKQISHFQAIQFMISEMAMNIEAARLLVHKAGWLCDQGQNNTQMASFAKAFAADSLMKIATDAVQIFGGYGYSREYPVEKIMRDAKLMQIYEGTSQIQRLVIGKQIFSRRK